MDARLLRGRADHVPGETVFSEKANENLMLLKKALSGIRMPAAKMEKPGRKEPISKEDVLARHEESYTRGA
jgi:hypothetical protein